MSNEVARRIGLGAAAVIVIAAAITVLRAGDDARGSGGERVVFHGPAVHLHGGSARTYLTLEEGVPVELGVAIAEGVLAALPEDGAEGGMVMPDGHSTFEYVLEMPADNPTPFRHVTLDWNPAGHEPPGIYDRPHFDVHFYTISVEERRAIHPADPDFAEKAARHPPAAYLPKDHVPTDPVPMMGVHWIDPSSPELHPEAPEPFTRTFIWGSWDGRIIFAEPMVTTAFLETRPDVRLPVGTAGRYDPAGYYPASYSVRWDEGERVYRIALTDLTWRD